MARVQDAIEGKIIRGLRQVKEDRFAEFLECNDGEYYYYEPLNDEAEDIIGETFGNNEVSAVNDQGMRSCKRLANEKKIKVVIV